MFRAVEAAVEWGRARVVLDGLQAIGIDEVQWQRGHKYLTVVYEISRECRRLLWVGREREETNAQVFFICSDMWQPYLKVIADQARGAIHVLDRFHIVAKLNKAIDEVRAQESKELKTKGYEPLPTKSRWCLLKRPENLSAKQEIRLAELVRDNLKAVRSYLLKEDFQSLWTDRSPY